MRRLRRRADPTNGDGSVGTTPSIPALLIAATSNYFQLTLSILTASVDYKLGSSALIGLFFGMAKSIMVEAFVFIVAPVCALVIVFMQSKLTNGGAEREVGEEERAAVESWSELTILRFVKGTFSTICLVPLVCMSR